MPDGGARSATLERMTALSLLRKVRRHLACADHSVFTQVVDTYELAVGSPLSLLTFFAAAKKVSAAPHRGITNRPIRMQGKAKAARTTTSAAQAKKSKPLLNSQPQNPLPLLSLPLIPHGQRPDRTLSIPNLKRKLKSLPSSLNISPQKIGKNIIPLSAMQIHPAQPLSGREPDPTPFSLQFMRPIAVMNIRGDLAPAPQPINHRRSHQSSNHRSNPNRYGQPTMRQHRIERPHRAINQRGQYRQTHNNRHLGSPR
jgi:hypothetical protein